MTPPLTTIEWQLQQSQRLETLGTLAGGIAHDFNNQLTVILNNLAFSLELVGEAHAAHPCLVDALNAAQRCVDMTRGLLAFSRRVKPVLKPIDLGRLMEETERLLRRLIPASVAVRFSRPQDLCPILADSTQIQQVLMNLAVNARDAMPQGGTLDIRAENAGRRVVIDVADTGSGMPAEVRERVFEPFFTTKTESGGTGLGLATVHRIVKEHGGDVQIHSCPGEGTRFRITLPAADTDAMRGPDSAAKERRLEATVLVAEDNELVRRAATTILRLRGCRVLEAGDGEEAFRVFAENSGDIDLVFTDFEMPKCGGPALIDRVRLIRPEVKTLLASGSPYPNADALLLKPYCAKELMRRVEELLS